jgi:hypothetical protein
VRIARLAACLALVALPKQAHAQTEAGSPAIAADSEAEARPSPKSAAATTGASDPTPPASDGASLSPSHKRSAPDYDGRGATKATVGDVAVWVPRILLSPVWLTHEFVVRRPLGYLVTNAERSHWPTKVLDFFTFDTEHKSGIIPTAYYEFGVRPSVGVYFFWDDALRKGNAIRAHAATWGPGWLSLTVADRIPIVEGKSTFTMRGMFVQRPDGLFAGIGPRSRESEIGRFGIRRIDLGPAIDVALFRASSFHAEAGVRKFDFRDDEDCCGEPPIRDRVAEGLYALPPGFDGYTAIFQRLEFAIDSRPLPPARQTGVRFAMEAEHGSDVRDGRGRSWLRYGGQLGGFLDLDGRGRTIGLVLSAAFADPLGPEEIPFTEQVSLGGFGPMRGYRIGRLVDRSALVATFQYEWPIWVFLNGTLHVAAGNVWGRHLEGLRAGLLRLSAGIGFRTVGSPDHQFEFLVGGGTETFDDGSKITALRILFGGTRGF